MKQIEKQLPIDRSLIHL